MLSIRRGLQNQSVRTTITGKGARHPTGLMPRRIPFTTPRHTRTGLVNHKVLTRQVTNSANIPRTLPPMKMPLPKLPSFASAKTFVRTFAREYKKQRTKPSALGEVEWENPKREEIEREIQELQKVTGYQQGVDAYHASPAIPEMIKQYEENGEIEDRTNAHGEGLYYGTPEEAAFYGRTGKDDKIARLAATHESGTNTDYGTNTQFLQPGTGTIALLTVRKLNPKYNTWTMPWPHEAAKEACKKAIEATQAIGAQPVI